MEAESLLNDGVAAVVFALALTYAEGAGGTAGASGLLALARTTGGGLAVGALCGGVAVALAGRSTADHLVETALTMAAAYGSFLLADHFHVSGVLATVAAGLVMGNVGALHASDSPFFTERGREVVLAFWDFAAFVANSLIFLLIGQGNAAVAFPTLGLTAIAAAIALVWTGRALTVYPLCALFSRSRLRIGRNSPARPVLGWDARRAGPRPRPEPAAGPGLPQPDHYRHLQRRCFLRHRPGDRHAPAPEALEPAAVS